MSKGVLLEDAIAAYKTQYGFSDQAWEVFCETLAAADAAETALDEARAELAEARAHSSALREAGDALAHWLQVWIDGHPGQTWCYSAAALARWRALLADPAAPRPSVAAPADVATLTYPASEIRVAPAPRPSEEAACIVALEADRERLLRGMTRAHYELAEKLRDADTLWLMDLLDGLLGGKSADDAAATARHAERQI